MSLDQSDVDSVHASAEHAPRKAGERYRANALARQEESTD